MHLAAPLNLSWGGLSIFIMLASFQVEPLGITEHHAGVVAHGVAQGLVYEQNLVT